MRSSYLRLAQLVQSNWYKYNMSRYTTERKQKNAFNNWQCKYCEFVGRTRRELQKHRAECHCYGKSHPAWNKGLTKDNDERVKHCGESISKALTGTTKPPVSEETRRKLSESRKKYIAEHDGIWWSSRSNCKRSYAEEWTKKLLDNECSEYKYIEEYHIGRWFLDFAWPDRKIYIEIDGEQHNWPDRKKNDIEKDKYCKENGWNCLRLTWKYIMNNTQTAIQQIKDFVTSANSIG